MFGGFFLDAVASTKKKKNFRFGVNWVVVGLAVHLPFRPDRCFCLPVLWRAYRKKGTEGHPGRGPTWLRSWPGAWPGGCRTATAGWSATTPTSTGPCWRTVRRTCR